MNIFKRTLDRIRGYFSKKSPLLMIGVNIGSGLIAGIIPLPDTLKPVATMAVRGLITTIISTIAMWICYNVQPGLRALQDATFYTVTAVIATVYTVPVLAGSIIIAFWKIRPQLAIIVAMLSAKGANINANFQTGRVTIEGEYIEVA